MRAVETETIERVHPPTGIGLSLVVNETARVNVAAAPTSAAREDGPRPEILFRRRHTLRAAFRELRSYDELMFRLPSGIFALGTSRRGSASPGLLSRRSC